VHRSRAWRGTAAVAAVAAIGGLVAAGVGTAVAASAPPVGITIGTTSAFSQVTGDTLVQFLGTPKTSVAAVRGVVTNIPAQTTATVTLLSKPFGASGFTAGRPAALAVTAGTGSYSFAVAPAVATAYEVEVTETAAPSPSPSPSSSSPAPSASPSASPSGGMSGGPSSSPSKSPSPSPSPSASAPSGPVVVAVSAAKTVYVISDEAISGRLACAKPARPVCHVTVTYSFRVPIAAFKAESAKHLFLYSRVLLSKAGEPPTPKAVFLNTSATRSKVRKLTVRKFAFTAHYTIRVGSESFHYLIAGCIQDTESRDGIGLPGRHGCGAKSFSASTPYVG
jgi:hypothetical protein